MQTHNTFAYLDLHSSTQAHMFTLKHTHVQPFFNDNHAILMAFPAVGSQEVEL